MSDLDEKVGCVKSHFFDSGSFTLWTRAAEYAKEHKCEEFDFYDTDEHWKYLDDYAAFIKKYQVAIDLYANVDVIPSKREGHKPTKEPELTWRNQKYLEKQGLSPVPVVHYKTDLKWLRHYIDKGYEIIGLGGLVGSTAQDGAVGWIDRCFDLICDNPERLPCVKLHGFGITSYDLMIRYPWWSVDSTTWTKVGAYGGILVPHKRGGQFTFMEQPYVVKVSPDSPDIKLAGRHYHTLATSEKEIVAEWLEKIGLTLGRFKKSKEIKTVKLRTGKIKQKPIYKVLEEGVCTSHAARRVACLTFFEEMLKHIPEWPWAFRSKRQKGFGLV